MRIAVWAGLLLLLSNLSGCRERTSADQLAVIDVEEPKPLVTPELKIVNVFVGTGKLIVRSASKSPVRLWQNAYSWGGTAWRALRIRDGQVDTFYQNPHQLFSRNIPGFDIIGGAVRREETLDVNAGDWCSAGTCAPYWERGIGGKFISFKSGDLLVAVYDVEISREALDRGVWYGVTSASIIVP